MSDSPAATQEPIPYPFVWPTPVEQPKEYNDLRERAVIPVVLPSGDNAFLVTRYADVRKVLTDPRISKNADRAGAARYSTVNPLFGKVGLDPDPPENTRVRRAIGKAFTPRQIERLRPTAMLLAEQLADAMERHGPPLDLNEEFAFPLTIRIMCGLLGVPVEDEGRFRGWVDDFGMLTGVPSEHIKQVRMALWGYIQELVNAKTANPSDDVLSNLVELRKKDPTTLSEFELVWWSQVLLVSGYETTTAMIGCNMAALTANPGQFDKMRTDKELIPAAIEELLRLQIIFPSSITMRRYSLEPIEFSDGTVVPAGSSLIPDMISANRDEKVFSCPHAMDLAREDNYHLTFSGGPHYCLGVSLAKMELTVAYDVLLRRFPNIRLAVPPEQLRRKTGAVVERFLEVPVTW